MTPEEATINYIAGDVFECFQKDLPVDKNLYYLHTEILSCAIQDAFSDIYRASDYHSDSGASIFKQAAYIGKWISQEKPIQTKSYPVNLTNCYHLGYLRINANFAVYSLEAIVAGKVGNKMYGKLRRDLRYCFIFRPRMDADSIEMLLTHALQHSPENFLNKMYQSPQNLT